MDAEKLKKYESLFERLDWACSAATGLMLAMEQSYTLAKDLGSAKLANEFNQKASRAGYMRDRLVLQRNRLEYKLAKLKGMG